MVNDQPRSSTCRRFIGPNADQARRGIAEKASKLGDACLVGGGLELDERIIAADRDARTVQ